MNLTEPKSNNNTNTNNKDNANKPNQQKDSPSTNLKNNKQNTQKPTQPQKEVPFILPEDRKAINDLKGKMEVSNKQVVRNRFNYCGMQQIRIETHQI